jgi:phage-related tail fiber protein
MRITTVGSETPGLDIRPNVKAATTANITLSGTQTIDGVALVAGDRVLVKNQSTQSQNGVYIVGASTWSRATNFDAVSALEVASGALFFVSGGTANNGKAFTLTTTGTITLNSTSLVFAEFSGSPEVLAVVEPARPMGYSITHVIVERFTLILGDPIYGVLKTAVL